MMFVNPDTLWAMAQIRQDELLKELHMRQLWREVAKPKRSRPKFWRQLSWRLGDSMIAVGHRLQTQHTSNNC